MKLYTSIEDMPVYNWFKCIEDQAFEWCQITRPTGKLSEVHINECKSQFGLLYEQYVDKYGVSEQLQDVLRLQNQIMVHKIDVALGDPSAETFVDIKELELAKLMEVKETKGNPVKVAIEKNLGFKLDLRNTTVVEYYDYVEDLKNNKVT